MLDKHKLKQIVRVWGMLRHISWRDVLIRFANPGIPMQSKQVDSERLRTRLRTYKNNYLNPNQHHTQTTCIAR